MRIKGEKSKNGNGSKKKMVEKFRKIAKWQVS